MHLSPIIVLAEPHAPTRQGFARELCARGMDVLAAKDDVECIDHTLKHRPDVLVLTLAAPDVHAVHLVRALTVVPWFARVRTIALAEQDDCIHYRAAKAGDFDVVLKKPLLAHELAGAVQELLSGRVAQLV